MDARPLLDFGRWSWVVPGTVQAFLQQGQAEKSTTQPWDPSSSSVVAQKAFPLFLWFVFPGVWDLFTLTSFLWHLKLLEEASVQMLIISCICWWIFLDLLVLPPSPHNALSRFVWRKPALADTSTFSIVWQLFSPKLAGAKTTLGIEYPQVNIHFSLGHCSCFHGFPGLIHHYMDYVGFFLIN